MANSINFFNVFGIFFTLVTGFVLVFWMSRTLRFLKIIVFKLRIVLKNAYLKECGGMLDEDEMENKKLGYSDGFRKVESIYRKEIIRSHTMTFCNIWTYILERYHHLVYICLCWRRKRERENNNLLRP